MLKVLGKYFMSAYPHSNIVEYKHSHISHILDCVHKRYDIIVNSGEHFVSTQLETLIENFFCLSCAVAFCTTSTQKEGKLPVAKNFKLCLVPRE